MNVPETFFSVSEELVLFGLSCLFGMAFGAVYDVFRTARIIFPHNTFLVVIEDIVFLSGYAVCLSAFASAAARGELRFYYIIGNFIGFLIYFFTLGNVVIGVMKKLFYAVKSLVLFIFMPLKSVYVFLREKVTHKFVGNPEFIVKRIKKPEILLLKRHDMLYNKIENNKRKNVKSGGKNKKTKTSHMGPV